ncbi:MAG: hypothetical protein Q9195_006092 [Heterodermia aff. obscurata]
MERKNEIAAKKAKLAELRRQREEREQRQKNIPKAGTPGEDASEPAPSTLTRAKDRQELDSFITTLVGDGRRSSLGPGEGSTSSPARRSRPSSGFGSGLSRTESAEKEKETSDVPKPQTTSVATQTLSLAPLSINYEFAPVVVSEPASHTQSTPIPEPRPSRHRHQSTTYSDSDSAQSPSKKSKRLSRREREREEELRRNLRREIEEELKAVKEPDTADAPPAAQARYPSRELTSEELNAVIASEDFVDFVERSSKVIEKTLDEEYDVLVDYGLQGLEGINEEEDEGYGSSKGRKGRRMKEVTQFYDERWSKKRMISDLGFSPKFPELLLASYTKNPSAPQDPSGLVQIWNMHLHSRPEYTFHAASDVLTARFSPFHPSLILGGSYSGQILLWDTRSKSSLPVQKTPLTGSVSGGHTHPVYSISVVGTQNANNIISCSTDGVVCGWTVDMLSQPQEYIELLAPPPSKYEDLSPTCMSFPSSDPTSFLVGTEEGTIYPCHRYDRAGAKAGIDPRIRYKGHAAPIMGIDFHPVRGPVDLGDLVLSSALDWTVKIWKTRAPSSTSVTSSSSTAGNPNSGAEAVQPLLDFSRDDVVYDARWAPHKPGVFSLVDGAGTVEVWDLASDVEVPACTGTPDLSKKPVVARSLNKVVWEDKEGKRLAVGGASGVVSVFEVEADLAGDNPKAEEWASMKRLLARAGVVRT